MSEVCPECGGDPDYTVSIGMGAAGPCQTCLGSTARDRWLADPHNGTLLADFFEAVTGKRPIVDAPNICGTCNGRGRIACPGPTAKTNAERKNGRMFIDWCYGMHMGHRCPDCTEGNQ